MKIYKSDITRIIKEEIIKLREARLPSEFADYTETKTKLIASLKKNKAGTFTKYAKMWKDLDKAVTEFGEEKKKLNTLKQSIDKQKTELHQNIKTNITDLFDAEEQLMTLTVDSMGSYFTLNKKTAANDPKEKETIDYKAIYEDFKKLVEGQDGLTKQFEEITTKYTKVTEVAGRARGLKVVVKENRLNENSVLNRIKSTIKSLVSKSVTKLKSWTSKKKKELSNIDKKITKL